MSKPIISMPILRTLSWALHHAPNKKKLDRVCHFINRGFRLHRHDEAVTARLRSGALLPVHLNDYNVRMLFFYGTVDPKIIKTCRALLRPGDALLDIGANHGAVGLLCADVLGTNGAVHFVEPQPDLCEGIRAAASALRCRTEVHQIGLLDEAGEFELQTAAHHSGAASLVDGPSGSVGDSIRVRVREIGEFLDETVGDRPFGAKVDIEGAEMRILPQIIERPGLRFLLFECNRDSTRLFVRDAILARAAERSAAVYGLEDRMFRVRLKPIRDDQTLAEFDDLVVVFGHESNNDTKSVTPKGVARATAPISSDHANAGTIPTP